MANCSDRPKPGSYVNRELSLARRSYYMNKKFGPLTTDAGKPETIELFYSKNNFSDFLTRLIAYDAVRIYVAAYLPGMGPGIPPGMANKLTLIYAPARRHGSEYIDIGEYYIASATGSFNSITRSDASELVRYYRQKKLPILTHVTGLDSDTRSMLYTKSVLEELRSEMECQRASGVRLYFASYTEEETGNPARDFKKRLIILFTLTDNSEGYEKDFYSEERDGWDNRPDHPLAPVTPGSILSIDTGSPCPPAQCNETLPA